MDDAWERVVEAAIDGQGSRSSELRVLNLDGAVKSLHGCLPPAGILERYPSLEHLSIANVGVLSLEKFPRLRNLQRLSLSDNRIAGGLQNLVQAGLHSLRDLDLSNNRIQYIEDLAPLAKLHLVSLDLYKCPVTRVSDYRSKVFSMIRSLKYLDKLDANEDERPETDYDDDEEEEDDDYDDCDPGSGEVDGEDWARKLVNGCGDFADVDDIIVDADEDEESDADEEEMEASGRGSLNEYSVGSAHHLSNGFQVAAVGEVSAIVNEKDADEDVEVEDDDDDDDDLGEEIDVEEGEDSEVVILPNVFGGSDEEDEEEEDVVDDVEDDEVEADEEDDDEEDLEEEDEDDVDADEYEVGVLGEEDTEPGSSGRLARFEEEIDGHEHGEEDENEEIGLHYENGEIGEEDELVAEDRDVEEDLCDGEDEDDLDDDYLVQPIARPNGPSRQSDFSTDNEEDYLDPDDISQQDSRLQQEASNGSSKRRREEEGDLENDDSMEELRLSKRR